MIELTVMGIRLNPPEDSPILLLREMQGSRLLPIWISSVDAAAIAIVLEGEDEKLRHRPMTHDLLASLLTELGQAGVVRITEMVDGVFHAVIEVGSLCFDTRPSDAVAAALRLGWPIECPSQLMDQVGVEVDESETDEVERFREFLDSVDPTDFESNNT